MNERLHRIEAMLAASPEDQFLRYSLARELRKQGESNRCTALFNGLLADDPPHIPAFLMFAQYYSENEKFDSAREILRNGIKEASNQGDSHAAGEMGELLEALGSETEG